MNSRAFCELIRRDQESVLFHRDERASETHSVAGFTPILASRSLPVPFSKIKCERVVLFRLIVSDCEYPKQ